MAEVAIVVLTMIVETIAVAMVAIVVPAPTSLMPHASVDLSTTVQHPQLTLI